MKKRTLTIVLMLPLVFELAVNVTASAGSRSGREERERRSDPTSQEAISRYQYEQEQKNGVHVCVEGCRSPETIMPSSATKPPIELGRDAARDADRILRNLTTEQQQYYIEIMNRIKQGGTAITPVAAFESTLPAATIESLATRYRRSLPSDSNLAVSQNRAKLSSSDKAFVKKAVKKFTEELRMTPIEIVENTPSKAELRRK